MTKNKDNTKLAKSRRQLLKASLAGTGALVAGKSLPDQWSRPLVESVVLPAHAQTSLAGVGGGLLLSLMNVKTDDSIFDSLIPTAHAGGIPDSESMVTGELCCSGSNNGPIALKALIEFFWEVPDDLEDDCVVHDVAYFTGNVNPGVRTRLSLKNVECLNPNVKCWCTAKMNDGICSGYLEFEWEEIFSSQFEFDDPNCPIDAFPTPCNQGDCVGPDR